MGEGEGPNLVLANVGDLAKPADTFIKKVSKAIGSWWRPRQIRREARAEADATIIAAQADAQAALIKAQTEIEVTDLQRRAIVRRLEEDARQQQNIESIAAKAAPLLTDGAKPDDVDDDWIVNFFGKSRDVSNEQMQTLWARVLAGEFNAPGAFSRRTVNALADLDHWDCSRFAEVCNFRWTLDDFGDLPLICSIDYGGGSETIYGQHGVTFGSLLHLQSIGLLQFNSKAGFGKSGVPRYFTVQYQNEARIVLTLPDETNIIETGYVKLTSVGEELQRVCRVVPVPGFVDYMRKVWAPYLPPKVPSVPLDKDALGSG